LKLAKDNTADKSYKAKEEEEATEINEQASKGTKQDETINVSHVKIIQNFR